ncbi:PREDICTED: junctional protein associated with coronary artery disease isoform X1 [Cyprinodon variegatus]|uniref:Junctional cadherin 5 associated a n=2 Tax=Cyprinodon variegatus TaxID=28743 RepID=A0A3Q2GJ24_CYPVA|nr:PREDICTED: junctional protein associated with coronary artery disease isoform X1 [Cyprinodon variegatus]
MRAGGRANGHGNEPPSGKRDGLCCAAVPVILPVCVGKKQRHLDKRLKGREGGGGGTRAPAKTNATMYSVEDLLISHGYKLPRHAASSTPTPVPTSSSRPPPSSSPPSYNKHHEILENRSGHRTVNGYERGPAVAMGNSGGTRQPQVYVAGCPSNNNEPREGSQPKQEGENRGQTDTHSLGESLTSDSGFCDSNRGLQPQSKDVSYWRRRGQDFSVLLDYADIRGPHAKGHAGHIRPEGPQQARGQELSVEDRQRAAQERQRWAAQAQAQALAQAQGRSKEREAALQQWRMATERKCQSLGTEEWHPAVSFSRQMSQSEGERWAQEQQRLHARTPEGMVVHPRTKAKSQSLPRMLQPESLQYVDIALSGKEMYRRVNGHPLSNQDFYRVPRWPENGRPASANQLSITPKARFTRPPRPPSYEMHQQIRGSCEVLSGRESVTPQARDRTPIPTSRTKDPQLDYFAQDSGPPGYIPPPSYKRAPLMGGAFRGYGDVPFEYRYRGDMYPQIQVAPDGTHWFIRHPACSWPNPHRERSTSTQKQLYPVYSTQERSGGGVQYISFDDPRIRHISSALGGNSLTDADKIRHIRNELPSVTVSEPAPDDSAFLPPPLGPFISAKLADENNQTSSSNLENENKRWRSDLHKETISNFRAPDQNCNNRHLETLPSPLSPSSAFQPPLTRTFSRQGSSSDQVFAETITQVKTILPESGQEIHRNTKRRVSETIFCLVSVPVHTPTNINKGLAADQNNNEAMPNLTVTKTDTFAVGLRESPNIRSKSVNEIPIKSCYSRYHTTSTSSMRNYKRAPLRKEVIDAWVLQANEDKEAGYGGSWPGNQYRNQETQTGSPVTDFKSQENQSPTRGQETLQSVSDTMDIDNGTDSASSYGYPMTGQKNLHPSSNSAFSRLSLSPSKTPSLQHTQPDISSPTKTQNKGEHQLSSPKKTSPQESEEQLVFGQFLLKPVNRRPCDAIGELETINKEMEDTISKRPNVSKFKKDFGSVDEKLAWIKTGADFPDGPEPGREAISLPPMHIEKPKHIKQRSKSFASGADLESMEISRTLLKPQGKNMPVTGKQSPLLNPDHSNNCHLSFVLSNYEPNHLYRQDIPVPQESLLRDVGLTVYTETPGGPGEPMQRSLSVPSPLSHKGHSKALIKTSSSFEHNSKEELDHKSKGHSKSDLSLLQGEAKVYGKEREHCISPKKGSSLHITRQTMEVSYVLVDDYGDERYALTEPLTYNNDSTIADKHLESLLIQEKANTLPAEDLSNLFEVKCAKGIPENESIEERAARILGISVPVEALCVADNDEPDIDTIMTENQQSLNEETQYVKREFEQVNEDSLTVKDTDLQEIEEVGLGVAQGDENRLKHSRDHSDGLENQDPEIPSVLEIPEFPPSKLRLSLPVTPDETLSLSICSGENKGRGGTGKLIESLQDKLNCSAASSAAASTGSTTDRMARFKELDSVSRIRRLSLKSPDSVEEPETKEREDLTLEVCKKTENVVQRGCKEEGELEENRNRTQEEDNLDEHVNLGNLEEPQEVTDEMSREELIQEEEVRVCEVSGETGQTASSMPSEEKHFKLGVEERIMELRIVEDNEKTLRNVKEEHNPALVCRPETTQHAEGGKLPIPKQRTKLQKPPLLPKPRSVPKREITLPLSFSAGTCGTSDMEDEEMLSGSDSYDPSRVERV